MTAWFGNIAMRINTLVMEYNAADSQGSQVEEGYLSSKNI